MGKRMKRHHQTCLLAQSDNTCLLQGREGACVLAVVVVRRSRPCAIQMWRRRRSTRLNDVLVAYTGAVKSDIILRSCDYSNECPRVVVASEHRARVECPGRIGQ